MAQAYISTINPNVLSGDGLAALLNNFSAANVSNNLGSARPSYLTYGGLWSQQTGTTYNLYLYTSGGDQLIASWSVATGLLLSGQTTAPLTAGTIGGTGSLTVSSVGAAPFNANVATLSLVNDNATPGNNFFYGTSPTGVKAWAALPTVTTDVETYTYGTTPITVPVGAYAATVVLYSAGGASAIGQRVMFTTPVTPGAALSLVVGQYGSGTTASSFAGASVPVTGTVTVPGGVRANTMVPALLLPGTNTIAGTAANHGAAMITWSIRSV